MRFRPNGVFPETTEGGSRLRGRAFFVRSVVSPTDHWMQGFGPGPMCILAKRENLTRDGNADPGDPIGLSAILRSSPLMLTDNFSMDTV